MVMMTPLDDESSAATGAGKTGAGLGTGAGPSVSLCHRMGSIIPSGRAAWTACRCHAIGALTQDVISTVTLVGAILLPPALKRRGLLPQLSTHFAIRGATDAAVPWSTVGTVVAPMLGTMDLSLARHPFPDLVGALRWGTKPGPVGPSATQVSNTHFVDWSMTAAGEPCKKKKHERVNKSDQY
jgi:hypothetical protein